MTVPKIYNPLNLVLCESPDGWSLHPPGATDDDIATGTATAILDGPGDVKANDYRRATSLWIESSKVYVVEIRDVSPRTDRHAPDTRVQIWHLPARENSSNKPRLRGWCGTTNNVSTTAHGVFKTVDDARKAIAREWPAFRVWDERNESGDPDVIETYSHPDF